MFGSNVTVKPGYRSRRALFRQAALIVALACSGGGDKVSGPPQPEPVRSVQVQLSLASIFVDQTAQATAQLKDGSGTLLTGRQVTWQSSDSTIAAVTSDGSVKGRAPGTASIIATSENITGSATIVVSLVPVSRVVVSLPSSSILPGATMQASAALTDSAGRTLTGRTVAWTSSDTTVAAVAQTGVITARKAGSTTVRAESGGISGTALLTVSQPAANRVVVSLSSSTIVLGRAPFTQATAVVTDANGVPVGNQSVTWSSSDLSVASVSQSGQVVGLAGGSASITATASGISGASTVTVNYPSVILFEPRSPTSFEATVGTEATVTVGAVDIDRFVVTGVKVHFTVVDGGGSVDASDRTTTPAGASTKWRVGTKLGLNHLVATAELPPGIEVRGNSIAFQYYGHADKAAQLIKFSGDGVTGVTGRPLVRKPVVRVLDQYGNGEVRDTVTWSISGGSGSLRGRTVFPIVDFMDISYSLISLDDWVLGPGSNSVTATVKGMSVTFTAQGGAAPTSPFTIEPVYTFSSPAMARLQRDFTAAADRWRELVISSLPDTVITVPNDGCGPGSSALITNRAIHGMLVVVGVTNGPNFTGGICVIRQGSKLTLVGTLNYPRDVLTAIETGQYPETAYGAGVLIHELGHALGMGTSQAWSQLSEGLGTSEPVFRGPNALGEWSAVGGGAYVGRQIPISNDGHWDIRQLFGESTAGPPELWMPISRVTAGALKDFGWSIDEKGADPFLICAAAWGTGGPTPDGSSLCNAIHSIPLMRGFASPNLR
jgi:uncharacterized protein YjdB